jgi:hypothetical protein
MLRCSGACAVLLLGIYECACEVYDGAGGGAVSVRSSGGMTRGVESVDATFKQDSVGAAEGAAGTGERQNQKKCQ